MVAVMDGQDVQDANMSKAVMMNDLLQRHDLLFPRLQ